MPEIKDAVEILDRAVPDPTKGLGEELFLFVSRMTPLVNVDLLVRDERGRVLLSWRDDDLHPRAWHVPGGVIRLKETMAERIRKVARNEIGVEVAFNPVPIAVNEMIKPHQRLRGHFISLLIDCRVPAGFEPDNGSRRPGEAGFLQWHDRFPDEVVDCQVVYRDYFRP